MSDGLEPAVTAVVADSDVLVRDIVTAACASHGIDVVATVSDPTALNDACRRLSPSVAITADRLNGSAIDVVLPGITDSGTRTLVLTGDTSSSRLTELLLAGASGFLLHDASPTDIAAAVLAVARGAAALNFSVAAVVLDEWRQLRGEHAVPTRRVELTPRERDVLVAMGAGLSTKGIARHLDLATKTVENHKIRIFDKLGVRNQAHAVAVAVRAGLLTDATQS